MCFHRVKAPIQEELLRLTHTLTQRVARFLERRGLLERDVETCERYGAKVKVIASIEAPAVIAHILKYLKQKEVLKADIQPHEHPPERTPR